MSEPITPEEITPDFQRDLQLAELIVKVDKLIAAVNSLGDLAVKHDQDLTAIVATVNEFRQTVSNMNPREMIKGLMSRG